MRITDLRELSVPLRGNIVPRARFVAEITADLPDHYSQMAAYLRLNGILPPSAQPQPRK